LLTAKGTNAANQFIVIAAVFCSALVALYDGIEFFKLTGPGASI
jgi:hypothetical protein